MQAWEGMLALVSDKGNPFASEWAVPPLGFATICHRWNTPWKPSTRSAPSANTSYPRGMEKILSGQIDLSASTIKAALLTDAYTYSTSHEFLSQCGARVGVDQTLNNVSVNGGVFDADDLDFGPIAPGPNLKAVVIYKDTGNPTTSPVLFHYDTVAGLPHGRQWRWRDSALGQWCQEDRPHGPAVLSHRGTKGYVR